MATKHEYSIGTNAAIPVATAFIESKVPRIFWGQVTTIIPELVAQIVVASSDAIDASRVTTDKGDYSGYRYPADTD